MTMICTCDVAGVRAVEERRLRIYTRMGLADMNDLTLAIVLSLGFDFGAVGEIYADQWFGVELMTPLVSGALSIECDWPADGLAALWENLADRFPDCVSVNPNASAMAAGIVTRISAGLFTTYAHAEAVYRAHRAAAHKGDDDSPCEDCSVYRALMVFQQAALDEAWGAQCLDAAIEKALE